MLGYLLLRCPSSFHFQQLYHSISVQRTVFNIMFLAPMTNCLSVCLQLVISSQTSANDLKKALDLLPISMPSPGTVSFWPLEEPRTRDRTYQPLSHPNPQYGAHFLDPLDLLVSPQSVSTKTHHCQNMSH